jgi:dTMP kinase
MKNFIVFEGVDHSGKTTQVERAVAWLRNRHPLVTTFREPGGTATGELIRHILLNKFLTINPRTELLLFMASRVQLQEELVKPALADGTVVVQDRYWYSTAAYQGGAGKLGFEEVEAQVHLLGLQKPQIVIYLDGDPRTLSARHSGASDRIEAKGIEYQEKVRAAYLVMARQRFLPGFFRIVNAERPVAEVHSEIAGILDGEGF